MKALYAGPWIGEFGHEIMIWQAYLRGIASNYEHITVCGPPGHFGMYEDFAHHYISFQCDKNHSNMWMNDDVEKDAMAFMQSDENILNANWITPRSVWSKYVGVDKAKLIISIQPRKFVQYAGEAKDYDILYHARFRNDWDSGFRNWPEDKCRWLLSRFPDAKIGCVGLSGSAHYCGGDDLRDIPLEQLTAIMSKSKVFVGPISGPCHLATLCGLPQTTWATKAEHAERVLNKWNPFNTEVKVTTADDSVWKNRTPYTPSADEIEENIRSLFNVETNIPV